MMRSMPKSSMLYLAGWSVSKVTDLLDVILEDIQVFMVNRAKNTPVTLPLTPPD
jgi:hypothetical protein